MFTPQYIMFFDNHTHRGIPDVGAEFDAELFADQLQRAGVDLVGFHAKCNQGFCYYNTKIGIRHPSLASGRDLFGEVVSACNKRNIRVTAYFNAGLSNETAKQHPEWCQIGPEGNFFHPEIEGTPVTPYMRLMCLNSPWRDQLMAMVREVLEQYPVSGFLFDGLNGFPCLCSHCVEGMRRAGLDPLNKADAEKFGAMSALRLGEDLAAIIEPKKSGRLFNCLGLGGRANARLGNYLECECLPTVPCWGYDWLPIFSRYDRNLTDGPVFNMTGRFYDWGDFGTLRSTDAIEYDLFFGLAQGMRPNIGDHLHPRGVLFNSVFDTVKTIYDKIRRFDPWYKEAKNPTDVAVLFPAGDWKAPLVGAVRMLSELQVQFEIVDMENDWSRFKVLLLPDTITFDEAGAAKLRAFLAAGGKVIATGRSGVDAAGKSYVCEAQWGAVFKGTSEINPPYYRMTGDYAAAFPDLPLGINARGCEVAAAHPGEVAGVIVSPYFNKHWDGVDYFYYTPPDRATEIPFLILGKQVALCPWNLCEGYYNAASPETRQVLGVMLKSLLPQPLVGSSSLPNFCRVIVADQKTRRNVHLFNYLPELRGKMLIVDKAFPMNNVKVAIRTDGRSVKRVVLAPEGGELAFRESGGYVEFTVPELTGYALASIELQ